MHVAGGEGSVHGHGEGNVHGHVKGSGHGHSATVSMVVERSATAHGHPVTVHGHPAVVTVVGHCATVQAVAASVVHQEECTPLTLHL